MHAVTAPPGVARQVLHTLADLGFTVASGVPCSLLKGLFTLLEGAGDDPAPTGLRYLPAPREDSAIGVASGAAVAGEPAVVLMQNSGLGYSLNVLTSFNLIYDVPLLLIVSWRGYRDDAVEHDVIGRELLGLLDLFGLPHTLLEHADPVGSVKTAFEAMRCERRCSVLIVREGV